MTVRTRSATLSVLVLLVLTSCGVPIPGDPPQGPADVAPRGAEVDTLVPLDEGTAALIDLLLRIAGRATEVREALTAVTVAAEDTGPDTGASLRAAGDAVVGLLLGTPAGGTGPGLLPAIEPDRGGTATTDLVTELITAAGDVGGERSRVVVELVRDPMLGDLGAWQRDPVGIIALLRTIAAAHATDASDLADLDAALLEIPGALARSLGYALVISTTDDGRIASHAADRATGHLGVVLVAIELAIEQLEAA